MPSTLFVMGRHDYSKTPGFVKVWAAYPHAQLRSVKSEAFKVWCKLHLEWRTESVLRWIESYSSTEDWRQGRRPGLQVWLKRVDFSEAAPPPADDGFHHEPPGEDYPETRPCQTPECTGRSVSKDFCNRCIHKGLGA